MTVVYTKTQLDSIATKIGTKIKGVDIKVAGRIHSSEKGVALGVATLGADGRVPNTQLPTYGSAAYKDVGIEWGQVPLTDDVLKLASSKSAYSFTGDCNDLPVGSFVLTNIGQGAVLNSPPFDYAHILTMQGYGLTKCQIAFGYLTNQRAFRNFLYNGGDGVWGDWKVVATTDNLGTAATKNVGTAAGNVMEVGAFGIGNSGANPFASDGSDRFSHPMGSYDASYVTGAPTSYGGIDRVTYGNGSWIFDTYYPADGTLPPHFRKSINGNEFTQWYAYKTTQNTTQDANGFLRDSNSIAETVVADATGNVAVASIQAGIGAPKLEYRYFEIPYTVNSINHNLTAEQVSRIVSVTAYAYKGSAGGTAILANETLNITRTTISCTEGRNLVNRRVLITFLA